MALKRAVGVRKQRTSLFRAGVLGNSLGTFRDGMLSQLSRKDQSDCSLDLSAGDSWSLVVMSQSWSLSCNSFKYIINKAVHDAHSLARYTSVRVHLLENFVDVDAIALFPLPFPLLISRPCGLGLSCLLSSFAAYFWWHVSVIQLLNDGNRSWLYSYIAMFMQMRQLK